MLQNYGKLENMEGNGGQGPENQDIKSDPIEITEIPSSNWREKTQEEVDVEVKRIEDKTSNSSLPEGYDIDPSNPNYMISKKTGKKFPRIMAGGSGSIADPNAGENVAVMLTLETAIESRLTPLESGGLISDQQIRDFVQTINEKFTAASRAQKDSLIERVHARIKYHNVAIKAQRNAKEYGAEFKNISYNEHAFILNTPGVRQAIAVLEASNGAYFRAINSVAAVGAPPTPGSIQAIEMAALAATGLANPIEAAHALTLAKKATHVFGDSAYYDGIRTAAGPVFFTGPNAAEQYAQYFEDHWGDIDFVSSLSGQGARAIRDILYLPINLQKNKIGREGLRKFASLWVSMGPRVAGGGFVNLATIAPVGVATISTAAISATSDWAEKQIASAGEKADKLWKGADSVLVAPLVGANKVETDNMRSSLPDVLKTYESASAAFEHLSGDERLRAMARLLKNILKYHNDNEASTKDGFHFFNWNNAIINEALNIEIDKGNIDKNGAAWIRGQLGASRLSSSINLLGHEMSKGLGGYLKGIFGSVSGSGGKR